MRRVPPVDGRTRAMTLTVMLLLLALVWLAADSQIASAQPATNGGLTAPAPTTAPTEVQQAASEPGSAPAERGRVPVVASDRLPEAVLLFGLVVALALLFYLFHVQRQFYSLQRTVIRRTGTAVPADDVSALVSRALFAGPPQAELAITGPAEVPVGEASAYSVTPPTGEERLLGIEWSVEPGSAAALRTPADTPVVELTALQSGTFTLSVEAQIAGRLVEGTAGGRKVITATTSAEPAGALPFVGAGYGTLLLAVVLLAVLAVLALTGTIGGEVAGTLLGTLAGYIFARGSGSAAGGRAGSTVDASARSSASTGGAVSSR